MSAVPARSGIFAGAVREGFHAKKRSAAGIAV
jgi:hypothetical protein